MKEKAIREAIREAINLVDPPQTIKEEKETMTPQDKEHLTKNKEKLNEELLKKWGYQKKKG